MTATWTEPKTWETGELVTADKLNEQLRDNLLALKEPASAQYKLVNGYSTTSTVFVDVDVTNLSLTLTTNGGDVLVSFLGSATNTLAPAAIWFDVHLNTLGGRLGHSLNGLSYISTTVGNNHHGLVGFNHLITSLAPGTHTLKLQWKNAGGVSSLFSVAQFWAREVS